MLLLMIHPLNNAFFVKKGVPPTERKARTGELTPPGMTFWALVNKSED